MATLFSSASKIVSQNFANKIIGFLPFLIFVLLAGCSSKYPDSLAFITNERDGTIYVIDLKNDQVIDKIFVGARPRGIRVTKDGTRLCRRQHADE
jgi:YVTN family beta-propeller protein